MIPHVAGLMAISDFPMAPVMVADLAKRCITLSLRFDTLNGDKELFKRCVDAAKAANPAIHIIGIRGREAWNRWNWREQLIRSLDPVKPDIVLFPDSDERFDIHMDIDLDDFWAAGMDMAMFEYTMATEQPRNTAFKYPAHRHCKAFRWYRNVGYRPYRGYARPTFPKDSAKVRVMTMAFPIHHYCFFTEEMQWAEQLHT